MSHSSKYSTQKSKTEENSMRRCVMQREDRAKVVAEIKKELKHAPFLETKFYSSKADLKADGRVHHVLENIKKSDPKWIRGPKVSCETAEVVDYILKNSHEASKTVYHNFASAKNEGGGFKSGKGALAQEEALCMCSNLWSSLTSKDAEPYYRENNASPNMKNGLYTHGILYTPEVTFNRSGSLDNAPFSLLPDTDHVTTSVVTAPAINYGHYKQTAIDKGRGSEATAIAIMQERLDRLLLICLLNGKRHLVTGPWGCGVFEGKLVNLMTCFKKSPYSQYFKSIHFISPDPDTVKKMSAACK